MLYHQVQHVTNLLSEYSDVMKYRDSFKGDEERVRVKGSCEYNLLDKHIYS